MSKQLVFVFLLFLTTALAIQELAFSKDEIVGAWKDNHNRTVYVCGCDLPGCQEIYIGWSRPNTTNNVTNFAIGSITPGEGDLDDLEGLYWSLTDGSEEEDRIKKGDFWLDREHGHFKGEIDDDDWVLETRLYDREPGPSMCLKAARFEGRPRVQGQWQRTTSTNDLLYINICPDGDGFFRQSVSGVGGRLYGEFVTLANLTWFGRKFTVNYTTGEEVKGASIFSQVGGTILTEVSTNQNGTFLGRFIYTYIGPPDLKLCNLPYPGGWPVPLDRLVLLVFPAILIIALLFYPVSAWWKKRRGDKYPPS